MTPTEARLFAKLDELQVSVSGMTLRLEHIETHLQDFAAGLKFMAEAHALLEEIRNDVETIGMILGAHVPGREGGEGASEGDASDHDPASEDGNGIDDEGVFDTVLSRGDQ